MAAPQKSSAFGPYKYPIEKSDQYKSRITFQAIKVIPPEVTIRVKTANTVAEDGSEQTNKSFGGIGASPASLKVNEIAGEKADLYLPLSFQVNDGFDYASASLGLGGAATAAAMNSGGSIASGVMESLKSGAQSVFDLFKTGAVSRVAAVRGSQAIPLIPDAVKSAIAITARVTMNPNIRTQFNGVSVREFNFTFKFLPKSQPESREVSRIVKFFRFHSYPVEMPYGQPYSIAFDYPNMFKVRLLSEVGGMFKNIGTPIKLCYLKTVSTTYNPTSSVLHPDGSPTEIDLTLTFTEYKPLSRYDVVNEDNDSFYNFENAPSSSTGQTNRGGNDFI
jgi:hypothetical protein